MLWRAADWLYEWRMQSPRTVLLGYTLGKSQTLNHPKRALQCSKSLGTGILQAASRLSKSQESPKHTCYSSRVPHSRLPVAHSPSHGTWTSCFDASVIVEHKSARGDAAILNRAIHVLINRRTGTVPHERARPGILICLPCFRMGYRPQSPKTCKAVQDRAKEKISNTEEPQVIWVNFCILALFWLPRYPEIPSPQTPPLAALMQVVSSLDVGGRAFPSSIRQICAKRLRSSIGDNE